MSVVVVSCFSRRIGDMEKDRLKQAIKKSGRTQIWIANRLGVDVNTVWRWAAGRAEPDDKTKGELALLLDTSIAYLMGESDNGVSAQEKILLPFAVETEQDGSDNVTKAIVILRNVLKEKDKLPPSDREILRNIMKHGAKALEDDPEAEEVVSD